MGWWKIADSGGGIDFENPPSGAGDSSLVNAIGGRDTPEDHYNGDGPADVMGNAVADIAALYREEFGRDPYVDELKACLNFVLGPHEEKGQYDSGSAEEE